MTIGEAQGELLNWIRLYLSRSNRRSRNWPIHSGRTRRARIAIGFISPTSMSHTVPIAAGGQPLPDEIKQLAWYSRTARILALSEGDRSSSPKSNSSTLTSPCGSLARSGKNASC